MVYCSGSTLGIVPLDDSPFVLGVTEGLWSKLREKTHDCSGNGRRENLAVLGEWAA